MDALSDIDSDLKNVKNWSAVTDKTLNDHGASSFMGRGDRWSFLVVRFPIQGEFRCDGTATNVKAGVIVRLTPDLAQRAYDASQGKQ